MSELHVPETTKTLARAQNVISDAHSDDDSQSDMSCGVVRQLRTYKNANGDEYEQSVNDTSSNMSLDQASDMSYQNYDTPE
jgi:hypothetical protein